jgi:hypothetical protein
VIGWGIALRVASSPVGVAVIGVAATFGAYHLGERIGYDRGVDDQIAEQEAANEAQSAAIRERVRDVLDEIGADYSDDDVDSFLRDLAGDTAIGD